MSGPDFCLKIDGTQQSEALCFAEPLTDVTPASNATLVTAQPQTEPVIVQKSLQDFLRDPKYQVQLHRIFAHFGQNVTALLATHDPSEGMLLAHLSRLNHPVENTRLQAIAQLGTFLKNHADEADFTDGEEIDVDGMKVKIGRVELEDTVVGNDYGIFTALNGNGQGLRDSSPLVRVASAQLIGRYGVDTKTVDLLTGVPAQQQHVGLYDKENRVRLASLVALDGIAGKDASSAAHILKRLKSAPTFDEVIHGVLTDPNIALRAQSVKLLVRHFSKDDRNTPPFLTAPNQGIDDPHDSVREALIEALEQDGKKIAWAVPTLLHLFQRQGKDYIKIRTLEALRSLDGVKTCAGIKQKTPPFHQMSEWVESQAKKMCQL